MNVLSLNPIQPLFNSIPSPTHQNFNILKDVSARTKSISIFLYNLPTNDNGFDRSKHYRVPLLSFEKKMELVIPDNFFRESLDNSKSFIFPEEISHQR